MIKTEEVTINGRTLLKTYSEEGNKLLQTDTNILYGSKVYDVLTITHTYAETTEKDEIEEEEESEKED